MATDIHLDKVTETFRKEIAEKKEMQDLLIDEIKKKSIGEIEEKLNNMVLEANKNLERLKSYNDVINRLIAAQNRMLKRIGELEDTNDNFIKLRNLMVGITILASGFTIINGLLTAIKFLTK